MNEPRCCYIPDDQQGQINRPGITPDQAALIGCQNPAEYELTDGPRPDDYTHACVDHVGHLLQDGAGVTVHALALG